MTTTTTSTADDLVSTSRTVAIQRSVMAEAMMDWRPAHRLGGNTACKQCVIGVLPGEGIGPEVIAAALDVLHAVEGLIAKPVELRFGSAIGVEAERLHGRSLTPEVIEFCQSTFDDGGAVLCGPGGNRFVYDLRRRFDLYCKFTPIEPSRALATAGPICDEVRRGVDIVVVRENTGGVYFGVGKLERRADEHEIASHTFSYSREQVERIVHAAGTLALKRRGKLCMVLKPSGVPEISRLWTDALDEFTASHAIEASTLEIDNAMYQLIAQAQAFDVLVAPNLFGDILSDTAALLLGSRGMSYSGNFGPDNRCVFQTGHGSAHDLKGRDVANPIGQICSLAMMLREAFGAHAAADAIKEAIERALGDGLRTPDVAEPGSRVVGTRELGRLIAERVS